MYSNIADFLNASPEWIKSWLNSPVKAKYKLNPLMIPEIISNILIFLPLNSSKGVNKTWDKEIDLALGKREKFLKGLTLEELRYFFYNHLAWYDEVKAELYQRDQQAIANYWEVISEYENASKELDRALYTRASTATELYEKFTIMAEKKGQAFANQVEIEELILRYGFAHGAERDRILYNIQMLFDGLDPHEIPASIEEADPLDYWDDEDPDEVFIENIDLSEVEWLV